MIKLLHGGESMKKIAKWSFKLAPAMASCLALVISISANSSGCFFLDQPKEPESIKKFKKIK